MPRHDANLPTAKDFPFKLSGSMSFTSQPPVFLQARPSLRIEIPPAAPAGAAGTNEAGAFADPPEQPAAIVAVNATAQNAEMLFIWYSCKVAPA
jgi:hypothetical protein